MNDILICAGVSTLVFIIGYVIVRWTNTSYEETSVFTFKREGICVEYEFKGSKLKPTYFPDNTVYIMETKKYVFGELVSTKYKLIQHSLYPDYLDYY